MHVLREHNGTKTEFYRTNTKSQGLVPAHFALIIIIIESVDSISRDEQDASLTQYITNAGITRARYTITHFNHHHRVLWLISNRMSA